MGTYAYRYCMCFTRKFRSPDAQPPPDVRAAHLSLSRGGDDGLRQFLSQVQGESPADVHRILATLTATTSSGGVGRRGAKSPSLDEFFRFLFSPELNPPIADQVLCSIPRTNQFLLNTALGLIMTLFALPFLLMVACFLAPQ